MPASLLGLLACGHGMAFIDRYLPAVAAPLLRANLGLSDTQMGLLDGPAFVLLYGVGMLASWPLARSPYRLRLLAGCIATWMLGMAVFALGNSFGVLIVARALVGLGQAAFVPLALGLIVDCSAPRWRARSMALFTAASSAGHSLSMLLGGATLALLAKWTSVPAAAHWRWLFLVMAAPNAVLILLLLRRAERPYAPSLPPGRVFSQMRAAFRESPWVMSMYLCGAGASMLVIQSIGAWAPSVLHREQGLTPATAALVFGASLLVAAPLANFIAGTLVDKRGEKLPPMTIMAVLLLMAVPVFWFIPWSTSAVAACVLLTAAWLIGAIAAVTLLVGLPSMLSAPLHDMGLRVFLTFVTVVGVALGPLIAGVVSDGMHLGTHGLSWGLSEVCLGAAIVGIVAALLSRSIGQRVAIEAAR
ncbi:MFS transporter [Dyella nitratireducens]|uniref:MFS transporter n=2 Tax=Dyella nitratireducens TaxID=1849580 RepID=A0ABQ1FVY7_9GAMM|nr:MFS transporter [Dyella nitratireducens]GLQ42880.1 MFS transporter [Dyella nitratireducens]